MNWTIVFLLVFFIGFKFLVFWLIKNRSAGIASWTIFLIVFVFSGFFVTYASIKASEAEEEVRFAKQMAEEQQSIAQANAEEAHRQAEIARQQAGIAQKQLKRAEELAARCK